MYDFSMGFLITFILEYHSVVIQIAFHFSVSNFQLLNNATSTVEFKCSFLATFIFTRNCLEFYMLVHQNWIKLSTVFLFLSFYEQKSTTRCDVTDLGSANAQFFMNQI